MWNNKILPLLRSLLRGYKELRKGVCVFLPVSCMTVLVGRPAWTSEGQNSNELLAFFPYIILVLESHESRKEWLRYGGYEEIIKCYCSCCTTSFILFGSICKLKLFSTNIYNQIWNNCPICFIQGWSGQLNSYLGYRDNQATVRVKGLSPIWCLCSWLFRYSLLSLISGTRVLIYL